MGQVGTTNVMNVLNKSREILKLADSKSHESIYKGMMAKLKCYMHRMVTIHKKTEIQ